jgi:hypothetical protein
VERSGDFHTAAVFRPVERVSGTIWMRGWARPRNGLYAMEKRKLFLISTSNSLHVFIKALKYVDCHKFYFYNILSITTRGYSLLLKELRRTNNYIKQ